jgi:hypothetical protein
MHVHGINCWAATHQVQVPVLSIIDVHALIKCREKIEDATVEEDEEIGK